MVEALINTLVIALASAAIATIVGVMACVGIMAYSRRQRRVILQLTNIPLVNAEIVTASLLYGGGDYGRSICRAVQTGFDTDCNGATVGSNLGMRSGAGCIGSEWSGPVVDKLHTSIFGMESVTISEMAEKTLAHIRL